MSTPTIGRKPTDREIAIAKEVLEQTGHVVLKEKSYRQAQERQRVADALREAAEEWRMSTQRWAEVTLHDEIRELMARCTFFYGEARARGATVEELKGGWKTTGVNCPNCSEHYPYPREVR